MSRIIPNEETYVKFVPTIANIAAPTVAELGAGTNLTPYIISINASTRGNVVQTPSFDTRFETSIPGTVTSTFEADMYRDDASDTAWDALPRETKGYFVISRFGGSGALNAPVAGDSVEVWPVFIVSRSATNLTSNTAQTFQVMCSVYQEPNEDALVAA